MRQRLQQTDDETNGNTKLLDIQQKNEMLKSNDGPMRLETLSGTFLFVFSTASIIENVAKVYGTSPIQRFTSYFVPTLSYGILFANNLSFSNVDCFLQNEDSETLEVNFNGSNSKHVNTGYSYNECNSRHSHVLREFTCY